MVAPETSKGPALIALMTHFRWAKVAMLVSTYSTFFKSGLGLTNQLRAAGMEVLKPAAFDSEPGKLNDTILSESFSKALNLIIRSGIRVVYLMAFEVTAIASIAQGKGLVGQGWAWMIAYMVTAVPSMAGWLFMQPLLPPDGMEAFARRVSQYSKSSFNISISPASVDLTYSVALYNAIALYSHAATRVLAEGGNLHDGQTLTQTLRNTTFSGMGGSSVEIDQFGDRIEKYEVMNYVIEADGEIGNVPVGVYNTQQFTALERAVVWPPGNTTEVPFDYVSGATWLCQMI